MTKKKRPQEYSPDEFDQVVNLIQGDAGLREDIEAITGQQLAGKTPRELFNLFRSINQAADIQAAVVRYGQARRAVRQTRRDLATQATELPDGADVDQITAARIRELETKVDELKAQNTRLKATNKGLMSGDVAPITAKPLIQGEIAS